MKLAYPEWNTVVELYEGRFPIIVIENSRYYRIIVSELYNQIKTGMGKFSLSEADNILNFDKTVNMIMSPFELNFEDARLIKKIYKELEDIAISEEYMETQNVSGIITRYILNLTDYLDYDMAMNDVVDLQTLYKCLGLKPAYDDTDLVTRFVDYLCLTHRLLNTKLFIAFGLRGFFDLEELKSIYKTLANKKIHLLQLETIIKREIIESEDVLTIDSDLCEI